MKLPVSRRKYDALRLIRESDQVYFKNKIKYLKKDNDNLMKILNNCRNELCLKCGNYIEASQGACSQCRWKH